MPELDALRGLAAVGVVAYHAWPSTFFLGWSCVDLFFVLSGFLISTIILEHVAEHGFFATFYFRRALRILPVGVGRGLADAVRGDVSGLGRSGAIVAAFSVTVGGYLWYLLESLFRKRARSGSSTASLRPAWPRYQ